ncbi:uncharacterized oxidoreductase YjmC-like [Diadema antillarum]|uniref:uncharacterized oxidoreductase YjmC-like n=1 Tax=Diadema antillarum TaxID=105358 RepID=UPI003A8ADB93
MAEDDYVMVTLEESRAFMERIMVATGTDPTHAADLAELLVSADHRGHFSHGLNRIDVYMNGVEAGIIAKSGQPTVLKELAATAWVDGENLLGPTVGKFCTDLAVQKAREAGIGCVVVKGSNHFGIAGWYSMRMMEAGMLGLSFTNTTPCAVPTRARQNTLGTHPIACAAPALSDDSFVLDMATTTAAYGKVEICKLKGQSIPNGWGCDSTGKETNDPKEVIHGGGLLPLGGKEISGGYKGYGLTMMVEVMTGILGGAHFGGNIRKWLATDREADLGQCFIAIDPEAFAPGFRDRMSQLMSMCRNAEPAEGESAVLVAGDPERAHMEKVAKEGGLRYHRNLFKKLDDLALHLGVEPIKRS